MDDRLIVTASPHIRDNATTRSLMGNVLIALVPSIVASGLIFGMRAILLTAVTTLACVVFEYLYCKLMHKPNPVGDLSACVTGVILALNMPVSMPLWIAIVGALVAIVIIKQLFGGLGCNFANPAITGRVFLLLSFAGDMTTWVKPFYYHGLSIGNQLSSSAGSLDLDAVTSATPLVTGTESLSNLFLGNVGGCIGETSALALLLGGLFLIFTRVISPSTPIAYLGSLGILTFFHALATGGSLTEVPYALLSGGVMIGAFFMATDYVTTPITTKGKWIFGIGCGILTFVIREFASMPEGCSFSILLMNLLTPYIDKFTMTKPLGAKPIKQKEEA